ncbi:hypothetical protein SASPL_125648 [Salvia splendens]|uniref:Wall-associated receptor kinase C-terminal domain-containing protein n=1 Tax=Salvia splendens TaxID=180675 RepID=A0A8X8XJA8_SALSN|nr:hypothetical protein SASPL_125648 [Salvia splendens]
MYDGNGNFGRALLTCEENVVARVGLYGDGREDEVVDVAAILRRGFVMNWTASDCSECQESGGRCGFYETSFHFSIGVNDLLFSWLGYSSVKPKPSLPIHPTLELPRFFIM